MFLTKKAKGLLFVAGLLFIVGLPQLHLGGTNTGVGMALITVGAITLWLAIKKS